MKYSEEIEMEAYKSLDGDPQIPGLSELPYIIGWMKSEIDRQHDEIKALKQRLQDV